MQDFYSNQLTSQRRSSTSSGTAITGNRSLERQQQQQLGADDMTTLPENSVEVNDAVNNYNAPASPKQQQQQSNCSGCDICMKMESTVLSLQADVEYFRSLALEVEGGNNNSANLNNRKNQLGVSVSSANNASIESGSRASSRRPTNFASRTSMFLNDASKRLADLSTRHKKQVKQTTKERAYWQNDMVSRDVY